MVRTVGVIRVGNGDRVLFMCQIGPIFPTFHIHTFVVPIIFWGRGGRIWFLCVAWKAATRVEFWKAGLNWAMAVLGRTKADIMRWEAAGAWRRTEGRMREAIAAVVGVQVQEGQLNVAAGNVAMMPSTSEVDVASLSQSALTHWQKSRAAARNARRRNFTIAWESSRSSQLLNPPHPPSSPAQRADAMASRQLALNFQRSLRSRAAINSVKSAKQSPLTRGLATPVSYGSKTESTTLSNGFTVWTA